MNFLVDAQLPRTLAIRLREVGHDAVHTLELPDGNRTTDDEINRLSLVESRAIITKDSDFVNSFLLGDRPWKLLLISTGNISNTDLETLFVANLAAIVAGFATFRFIEINRASIIYRS